MDSENTILYLENREKRYIIHTENLPFSIDLYEKTKYSDLKDGKIVYIDKEPPIHFFDVDFDGEKELIISYYGGWYGRPYYEVYKMNSDYPKLMDEYPFTELDCETRFDTINKTITNIYASRHDREVHIYKQKVYEYRISDFDYAEKKIMELDSVDMMELKFPAYIHRTYKRDGYKMKQIKRELVIYDEDIDINDFSAKDFDGGVFTDTIFVKQGDDIM